MKKEQERIEKEEFDNQNQLMMKQLKMAGDDSMSHITYQDDGTAIVQRQVNVERLPILMKGNLNAK